VVKEKQSGDAGGWELFCITAAGEAAVVEGWEVEGKERLPHSFNLATFSPPLPAQVGAAHRQS